MRASGFNEVWFLTPVGDAVELARLSDAVAAAKKHGLPARAVVYGFRSRKPEDAPLADQNVLGETASEMLRRLGRAPAAPKPSPLKLTNIGTADDLKETDRQEAERQAGDGEWLRPGADSIKARAEAIAPIAQTPGLAGLVVKDLVPPGYDYSLLQKRLYRAMQTRGGDLGYTGQRRLAFLRETDVDPIDISMTGDTPPYLPGVGFVSDGGWELPFFPSLPRAENHPGVFTPASGNARMPAPKPEAVPFIAQAWMARRAEAGHSASAALLSAIKAKTGALPLLATWAPNVPTANTAVGSYRLVEDTGKLLKDKPSFIEEEKPRPPTAAEQRKGVHETSRQVLTSVEWVPGILDERSETTDLHWTAREALDKAVKTHDGIVVDFGRLSLAAALEQLKKWRLDAAPAPRQGVSRR